MKQKDLLIILIPSFLITILWVIFSVYHNYVTSTIKDPLTYQIIPIDGTFNMQGIEKIKERRNFDPVYTFQGGVELTPTPEEEPSITPEDEEEILEEESEISPDSSESPTPTEEIIEEDLETLEE